MTRPSSRSIQNRREKLEAAIEQYRRMPFLDENSDPLLLWKGYDVPGSTLDIQLPLLLR